MTSRCVVCGAPNKRASQALTCDDDCKRVRELECCRVADTEVVNDGFCTVCAVTGRVYVWNVNGKPYCRACLKMMKREGAR